MIRKKPKQTPKRVLRLPDLDFAKSAVLNTLRSSKSKRSAIISMLVECGLRRSELAELKIEDIRQRDERWVILDLCGKGGHIRTVPVPGWVKTAIDCWTAAAKVTDGRLFICVNRTGAVWGHGITEKVIWCVVKEFALKANLGTLAPHDLRRTCARLCHVAGGELEQIEFLLGHVSVQTTERYLGCKQRLWIAVNDHMGVEPD